MLSTRPFNAKGDPATPVTLPPCHFSHVTVQSRSLRRCIAGRTSGVSSRHSCKCHVTRVALQLATRLRSERSQFESSLQVMTLHPCFHSRIPVLFCCRVSRRKSGSCNPHTSSICKRVRRHNAARLLLPFEPQLLCCHRRHHHAQARRNVTL